MEPEGRLPSTSKSVLKIPGKIMATIRTGRKSSLVLLLLLFSLSLPLSLSGCLGGSRGSGLLLGSLVTSSVRIPEFIFSSSRGGSFEILKIDYNGNFQANLTNNPAEDIDPVWSPDGTRIAFASNRTGVYQIYLMNFDGSNVVNLTNTGLHSVSPAWSSDGTKIVYAADPAPATNTRIFVMNADGTGKTQITLDPFSVGRIHAGPQWRPDGAKITYFNSDPDDNPATNDGSMMIMSPDGTGQAIFFPPVANFVGTVSWAPDGSAIAYATGSAFIKGKIFKANSDGSGAVVITAQDDFQPSWSNLGNVMVFMSNRDLGNPQIFVMNPDGTNQRKITGNEVVNGAPSLFWPR